MTYARPRLHALDLSASLACCGEHRGGCKPNPPPEREPEPTDPFGGILGCYMFGTC